MKYKNWNEIVQAEEKKYKNVKHFDKELFGDSRVDALKYFSKYGDIWITIKEENKIYEIGFTNSHELKEFLISLPKNAEINFLG